MKKTVFGLLLALSVCLAGCDKNTPAPAVEDQIAVLTEKLSALESEIDWLSYETGTQYAVTDLNDNGLLELVVSSIQGTGLFTTSYYYEVNEDGTGVTEWETNEADSFSEPDIGVYDAAVYVDDSGIRHYIFEDYIRSGWMGNWSGLYGVVYGNGQIEYTLLASRDAVYQESTQNYDTTYTDADGNAITEEAYNAIADTVFSGMERKTAHIGWSPYSDWAATPTVDALAQSYAAFSVE